MVLTARDEKRGLDAVEKLKQSGLSDHVIFHQLDVADPASVASLADFVKSQFGKLDILVNNAGISGIKVDSDAFSREFEAVGNWVIILYLSQCYKFQVLLVAEEILFSVYCY